MASTLGPRGRNVVIHAKGKRPVITKDGVTVAKFIDFEDEFENVGAQIIKQAASETNNLAGDGTTTSTVLARAILNNAQKYIAAGSSPVELKRGMDMALKEIVKKIEEISRPIQTQEENQTNR
jgi:chaperonin GroEL